jgi:hypothetical protein
MVDEPAESPSSDPPHQLGADARRQSEQERQGERFGPLVLTRYVKDDGRALILYARVRREHG